MSFSYTTHTIPGFTILSFRILLYLVFLLHLIFLFFSYFAVLTLSYYSGFLNFHLASVVSSFKINKIYGSVSLAAFCIESLMYNIVKTMTVILSPCYRFYLYFNTTVKLKNLKFLAHNIYSLWCLLIKLPQIKEEKAFVSKHLRQSCEDIHCLAQSKPGKEMIV